MKYNVPFMSPAHRESSFLHQLMEFEEDKMFVNKLNEEKEEKEETYVPNIGDFLKSGQTMESFIDEAQKEIDEMLKIEGNGR